MPLSEYRCKVWYGKTRMIWLPDGEKILKILLLVLTESTNVTDGRTDRRTLRDGMGRACTASHSKNCLCAVYCVLLQWCSKVREYTTTTMTTTTTTTTTTNTRNCHHLILLKQKPENIHSTKPRQSMAPLQRCAHP